MSPPPNNGHQPIDPIQYGMLLASVESLKAQQADMKRDFDTRMETVSGQVAELLALANKSKGGLWVGMSVAGSMGAVASLLLREWLGGKP